ncbi:MAG: MarC family NAAT transporter [Cyanobacteria bacterium P01_H01_bin.119]
MEKFIEFIFGSLLALFPIVDPIGSVPIFLTLTASASDRVRHQFARRTALNVMVVLIVFLLVGGWILRFFGISLEVVRIAGGIVVFHAAWQTMNAKPKLSRQENQGAIHSIDHHEDISFMPMTIPMLAGPGSIAVTLGLSAQAGRDLSVATTLNLIAAAIAIAVLSLIIYLCLRSSSYLLKVLGERGISAMSRIMGLFILAIGVQLILNGIADWLEMVALVSAAI